MKKILSLILISLSALSLYAIDSSWKMHPIFDEEVTHVVATPNYVYFTSRNMAQNTRHEVYMSLFRYDRKGDELMGLSTSNILNGTSVQDVIYNPTKGYLAVLYKDFNIDLLFNDGTVANIPYYAQSGITYSKNVNSMAIDPANDRLYLATDFGYVAVNDKKNEIAESRIYGEPLMAFCRLGDTYLALAGEELVAAPADTPRLSMDQYKPVSSFTSPFALYPVSDNICVLLAGDTSKPEVKIIIKTGDEYKIEDFLNETIYNIDYIANGLNITTGKDIYHVKKDGTTASVDRHANYQNTAAVSENLAEIWNGAKRKGLNTIKKSGEQWSRLRDWMRPNSPATFASNSYVQHPEKGFLVLNYGYTPSTMNLWDRMPMELSGYKQSRWTNYAPLYTNPSRAPLLQVTTGMALDPNNNSYLYITSYHNGILRLNLNNPSEVIHLSRPGDSDAGREGFAVLKPTPTTNVGYSNISAPFFDKQGNLWMSFANWDNQNNPKPNFYCWLAADRKASTPTDVKIPKHVEFDVYAPMTNFSYALPLLYTGNGLIVYSAGESEDEVILIDTNGTPVDTADDKYYRFTEYIDSDGNSIELGRVSHIWEDPSTGYVWLCHRNGVCYFSPSQVRNGNYQINRVKVSRNDGTNLADYLLDGVMVNYLTEDSEGRKWFSTSGGGIVCTSSDGREIINEFNTSNSPIPDDIVYSAGYNSETNSLILSTAQGFAEYSLPVSQSSSTKEDIRAYPNPVRPQYSGYVTITDIPTGSFVKIVDAGGNLVKELGIVSGFDILWDISDSNFNRVKSGVYYIMVSPSNENSTYSTVGKIMVIS